MVDGLNIDYESIDLSILKNSIKYNKNSKVFLQ